MGVRQIVITTIDSILNAAGMPDDQRPMLPEADRKAIAARLVTSCLLRGMKRTEALNAVLDYAPHVVLRRRQRDGKSDNYKTERRGVALIGNPGTGKTVAIGLLSYYGEIHILQAAEFAQVFAAGGEQAAVQLMRENSERAIIIDDLGAEREVQSFGNASPMADWLQRRYASWQRGGPDTHIVTNLSSAEMKTRYGDRVLDRLYEMCIVIPIFGDSLRTPTVHA